jgi:imidazolonepropionase-like amidohydrolase
MIISAQTLITGDGKTVLKDSGALIIDSKITAISKTADLLKAYPYEQHIDYGAATILPGLIDMHVHLGFYPARQDEKYYGDYLTAYLAQNDAKRFLSNGVTTLRDVASPNSLCHELVLAAAKGFVKTPRVFYCNQALVISGGIDWNLPTTVQVDGPDDIRKAVREQVKAGATWIKAMADCRTHGLADFDQDELNMIVKESHRRGCKAVAHANMQPALQMCIEAGFDTIEHACHLTVSQAEQMADKGLAIVSTFFVYDRFYSLMKDEEARSGLLYKNHKEIVAFGSNVEAYLKNYPEIYKTGVTILAGTDCPFDGLEHITVAWELECMVKCGMTPVQAIAAATSSPAKVLGMEGEIGILASAAIADIVVVEADADKNISALKQVKDVYLNGLKI